MELKDIIALVVGGLILIGIIAYLFVNEKSKIKEWLKWAVAEAEKYLGEKTGQLKLHQVYEWFCTMFPFFSIILPFKVFSAWVDVALQTLDKWLDNEHIAAYIEESEENNADKSD